MPRLPAFIVCLALGVPFVTAAPAPIPVAENTLSSVIETADKMDALTSIVRQSNVSLTAQDFAGIADDYGNLVASTRQIHGGISAFEELIGLGHALRKHCREKVRALEDATAEDEVLLETLYRSNLWYDISYALSAFGYWQAWARLGIAELRKGERDQASWLAKAESGFQSSSVRILYPGIVYGSWLGMGFVERARGDEKAAIQRFERLVEALENDADNPIAKIAVSELAISKIRSGQVPILQEVKTLNSDLAKTYMKEAFVLLQQHRETNSGAVAASKRLNQLIAQGYLDDRLLTRILAYVEELVGYDLGLISLCLDAEYAYTHQQYDTAVLKFRDFLQQGGSELDLNLSVFRFHYAVALFHIQQHHDSLEALNITGQQSNLSSVLVDVLPKMHFLVAKALIEQNQSSRNKIRALSAARKFIAAAPDDPDVSYAHLLLGRWSTEPDVAQEHLRKAENDSKLSEPILLAQLDREITVFNQFLVTGDDAGTRSAARAIQSLLKKMSRRLKRQLWAKALALQMRTVLGQELQQVLGQIDRLQKTVLTSEQQHNTASVTASLMWSKLRALDQTDQVELLSFLRELAAPRASQGGLSESVSRKSAMEQKEVYRFFLEKEQMSEPSGLLDLTRAFYPALSGQTQDQRQLRLLQVRVAVTLGEKDQAFAFAKKMAREFPGSGDAWVVYAERAEAVGDAFTAERAWTKISDSQPSGSPRWRRAMEHRIDLLTQLQGREIQLCVLLLQFQRYDGLLSPVQRNALQTQIERYHCQTELKPI